MEKYICIYYIIYVIVWLVVVFGINSNGWLIVIIVIISY